MAQKVVIKSKPSIITVASITTETQLQHHHTYYESLNHHLITLDLDEWFINYHLILMATTK